MKKYTLFVFDMFLVNFLLFVYLFTIGKVRVIEGGGNDWFFRSVLLSGISGIMDFIAIVSASVLSVLLFKNKLGKNYVYIYIAGVLLTATAFIFKLQIGNSLFNFQSTIKPVAVIFFSILLSFFYFVDFYKKVEGKIESVDAIFIGASINQLEKLKPVAGSGASVKNVDELVKLNKTVDSKTLIMVDLSIEEVKRIMVYLTFKDCRVAYLHSSDKTEPAFEKLSLEKWYESHEFIVVSFDEFIKEYLFKQIK